MKPILFNTEMVRANLDGRKNTTRRLVKPQPKSPVVEHRGVWQETVPCANGIRVLAPPYQVGDILYVRETWGRTAEFPGISDGHVVYAADCSDLELRYYKDKHFRWRPSIHMPKEYARLFLRVTDVRVERLQEITEAGAVKEGCYAGPWFDGPETLPTARTQFIGVWDSTIPNAEMDTYGWDANPWVWVIQYEKCEKPEEV